MRKKAVHFSLLHYAGEIQDHTTALKVAIKRISFAVLFFFRFKHLEARNFVYKIQMKVHRSIIIIILAIHCQNLEEILRTLHQ